MILCAVLIFSISVIWIVRSIRYQRERARENSQAFIDVINQLEEGETVFLNDIVPFEWDYFVIYDLYTSRDINRACMGRSWINDFTSRIYHCFWYEDRLVAIMTNSPIDFSHETILRNGSIHRTRRMSGTPDDNFEFFVTTSPSGNISLRWLYEHELIGTWETSDSLPVTLRFEAGRRGTEFNNGSEFIFRWRENDGLLMKEIFYPEPDRNVSLWSYSIDGDTLILKNEENSGEIHFERVD